MAYKQIEVNEEFIQEMALLRQPDKTVGLIEACSKSPVVFSEYMLGLKLYAWQVHFIHKLMRACEDKTLTREYVAITSRQIGKSTVLAVFSLWACIYNKYPGTIHNGTIVGIVSATDQQARTLLLNINKFIIAGDGFMKETYPGKFGDKFFSALLDNAAPNNTTTITFKKWNEATHGKLLLAGSKAGSTIQSFPPTSVVLGYTFTLILVDEVGMTEKIDDMFLISYLFPTGNSTNAIRVYTSTPWGADGYFYRLVDPEGLYEVSPADITMFTIDAIKLEAPKYFETVMKDIERMNSDGNIDDVQRSYYCRFVKGQSAYFNPDNVRNMFTTEYTMYTMYAGKCDMGVDFGGQVKSKTVITISELTPKGVVRRLYHKVYPVGKDITLLDDIAALKLQFNVQRIIPDDCLDKNTEVVGINNKPIKMCDLKVGDKILGYDFDKERYVTNTVLQSIDKGVLPTFELKLRNGTKVYATENHKFFTNLHGVVRVKELSEITKQERLIYTAELPNTSILEGDFDLAYLYGIYIAEGSYAQGETRCQIAQYESVNATKVDKIRNLLDRMKIKYSYNGRYFSLSSKNEINKKLMSFGSYSHNKKLPEEVYSWSYGQLVSLFEGLIDGDGNKYEGGKDSRGFSKSKYVGYTTISKELAKQILFLGRKVGLNFHYYAKKRKDREYIQYDLRAIHNSPWNKKNKGIAKIGFSKKEVEPKHMWDISLTGNQSFVLYHSGLVVHNCPAGQYIIRIMKDDKGWDVFPMNFRSDKVAKYGAFRSWLNKGKIFSYTDTLLQTEMLALEFNNGSRNSMIEHAPGYSDDLIDSFLMSTYFFVEDEGRVKVFDINAVEELDYQGSCPKCKSTRFQRTETKDTLQKRCLDCNHEWSEKYDLYD